MAENLRFHFTGALAEYHTMNFYEAARFQYAAARLVVKLAQFRATGKFRSKITDQGNFNVLLKPFGEGSFDITLILPDQAHEDEPFIRAPLGALLSFVIERLVSRTDDDELIEMLNSHRAITARFGQLAANNALLLREVLIAIVTEPDLQRSLGREHYELVLRRISEQSRLETLTSEARQIAKIDGPREQKLVSMSAPLLTEMATAFRRSANNLSMYDETPGDSSNILYLNKKLAGEIETQNIDEEISSFVGNIIQYNKENGWGKIRPNNSIQILSFSVPGDIKDAFTEKLLAFMVEDRVFIQCRFVRDKAKEIKRLIIVDLIPMPK